MPQVRAIASHALKTRMTAALTGSSAALTGERAAHATLHRRRHQALPRSPVRAGHPHGGARAPPGAPIGQPAMEFLKRYEPACAGVRQVGVVSLELGPEPPAPALPANG